MRGTAYDYVHIAPWTFKSCFKHWLVQTAGQ